LILLEIAGIMGSDATAAGIKFQVAIRFRPLGRAMLALKDAGVDPNDVDLEISPKKVDKQNGSNVHSILKFSMAHLPTS
jgi:hypothetical protein